ncbi:outer membrane autotransporter barrel [gamma proteobacterium HTCC5015]|nr:outer membrane autotransporter barrel [gamma proteobacterium HTCC5015]
MVAAPVASHAVTLRVDTPTIDTNTLDVYDLPENDAGFGSGGPGDGGERARIGLYECSESALSSIDSVEDLIENGGLNPDGNLDLVEAMRLAGSCLGSTPNVIELQSNTTYTVNAVDNYWYGPNALPPVNGVLTIIGNGATIEISGAEMRHFYVSGRLTLQDVTLKGGIARGGSGSDGAVSGGGGGAGLGGSIYNRGILAIRRTTFTDNKAVGGDAGGVASGGQANGAGGGVGGDAAGLTGGGFFNSEFLGGEAASGVMAGQSPVPFGISGLTSEQLEMARIGGSGADSENGAGGGGAFGGGGTGVAGASQEGGLGGGFVSNDEPGTNGGGWTAAALGGGAGGVGGGGGPGATGGFGGGSGGGQANSAFGGGAADQGGSAYGGAIFSHGGRLNIENTTFSDNAVEAGSGGSNGNGAAEGAGIYLLNTVLGSRNRLVFNTFFDNDCLPSCSAESVYFDLRYGNGISQQPEANGEALLQTLDVNLFGNVLSASASGSQPVVLRVDNPTAKASDEKLRLSVIGINNLVPAGKPFQRFDGAAVTWLGIDDFEQCYGVDRKALTLCGLAPKSGSISTVLSSLTDDPDPQDAGGLTPTHPPTTPVDPLILADQADAISLPDAEASTLKNLFENIERDQRGAVRRCQGDTATPLHIGSVQVRGVPCGDAPTLSVGTQVLLNQADYAFDSFGVNDERYNSDALILDITATNIATLVLPENYARYLDTPPPSAELDLSSSVTLEGRREQLAYVMFTSSIEIEDMSRSSAQMVFTLTDAEGDFVEKTLDIEIDTEAPSLSPELPNQVITERAAFDITVESSEVVSSLDPSFIQVVNGEVERVQSVSDTEYTLTLTADGGADGTTPLYFQFLEGAVQDLAGNASQRSAEPYEIKVALSDDDDEGGRSGTGGGSLSIWSLLLLLAGALRFRRNAI